MNNGIFDLSSKNESFINFSEVLKDLGVENSLFHLRLFDERLKGIDPFSDDLTSLDRSRIIKECTINPWYFLRECIMLRSKIMGLTEQGNLFRINRVNAAIIYSYLSNIDSVVCVPRQQFVTTSAAAVILWAAMFHNKNYNFVSDSVIFRVWTSIPDYIRNLMKKNNTQLNLCVSGKVSNTIRVGDTILKHHYGKSNRNKVDIDQNISASITDLSGHIIPDRDKVTVWSEKIYDWTPDKISNSSLKSPEKDCKMLLIHYDYETLALFE